MSNDKLNDTLAVRPEFAAGEQPDHNKLSQAFIHIYGALNKVEGAIGPARNDSQALYQNRLNNITNLTRQVGAAHGPQPRIPPGSTVVGTTPLSTNRKEWLCPLLPFDTNGGPHIVFDGEFVDENGASVFATEVSWLSPDTVMTATGEWIYDYRDNHVRSFSKLSTAGGTAIFTSVIGIESFYDIAYLGVFGEPSIHFGNANQNVIPHPLVSPATSVVVTESAVGSVGSYLVTLNSEVTDYDYHYLDFVNGDIPTAGAKLMAVGITHDVGARPFFDSTNLIAQTLPALFDDNLSADELIPKNMLMLSKDASTQAYPEMQYYYKDQTSFYAAGQSIATGSGYRVLVPGADLGQVVENNLYYMQYHRHRGPNAVIHRTISGRGYATDGKELSTSSNVGWNRPQQRSVIEGNQHPQYFMRNGWSEGSDPDNLDNAILGPMVFGYDTNGYATATNVAETAFPGSINAPTHGIYFGQTDFGGDIRLGTDKAGTSSLTLNNYGGGWLQANNTSFLINSTLGNTNSIRSIYNTATSNLETLNYSYVDIAGEDINFSMDLPADSYYNQINVFGTNMLIQAKGQTNCSLNVHGKDGTGLFWSMNNSYMYMGGTNMDITVSTLNNAYGIFLGDNLNHTLPTDTDTINGNVHYVMCSSYAINADHKYVTKTIAPTDWFCAPTAGGSLAAPSLTFAQSVSETLGIIQATSSGASDFFTLLHLPPDAHLVDFEPHFHHGGYDLHAYECPITSTAYEKIDSFAVTSTGDKRFSTDNRKTFSTQAGRQGHRYDDYGAGTSYDVMLRIENTSGATVGMTAAMSLYTYKLMRL